MPRKKQKLPPSRTKQGSRQNPKGQGAKAQADVANKQNKLPVQQNQRPIVPFLRGDRVLLIGEGDFSFARSLAKQYKCRKLLATCYDSQETLLKKYPQAAQNIHDILHSKVKSKANEGPLPSENRQEPTAKSAQGPKVLYSVDARKLGLQGGGGKEVRAGFTRKEPKKPAWKTKQSKSSPPPPRTPNGPSAPTKSSSLSSSRRVFLLLSAAPEPADSDDEWEEEEEEEDDEETDEDDGEGGDADELASGKATRTEPGQILVSLFEAEPYTLWNIKDLARHAGLQVVTSFRFPWASYEGYSHARTLGEVEGRDGGRGGWRGEDRNARMYVFQVKDEVTKGNKKKRARADSESE
ncbi:hypothetical protein N7468_004951 [Penicillium chermesinum]|uniref:25S rRNA (uridine-N(3))-methyltransferase BMT5-like domain-containing protein n=1 Tax=Penicillium chermesinum TaxID=63820 RepID=A0A9W9NYJ3_9EURO|nr:uncharacterized protein N7468_004951 [Penicillium chermesinum]KAJ5231995.1 hypothetical protein N7468_004951 [Penicillium chermesinum]